MTKIVIETDEVYELEEAASLLKIGIATLFRRLKRGEITPLRLGSRTYIPRSEVDRLKNKRAEG